MPRVLIIDDDAELLDNVNQLLTEEGFEVVMASTGADGVALAKARSPDIIVCDVGMPGMNGYEVLGAIRGHAPTRGTPFVFLTARADREGLRAGMNLGADDYVTKPFILSELLEAVQARLRRTSEIKSRVDAALGADAGAELAASPPPASEQRAEQEPGMLVLAPPMRELYAQLQQVAQSPLSVLIFGETGVGKEIVARELHRRSARAAGPFLPLNCAALNEQLLEAELFGHERGAFTGATHRREGRFKAADGGTLLLDEVGEIPPAVQAKLLRVLQEGVVEPLGSNRSQALDVRLICATHRNLRQMIAAGTFREDLYYRLNVLDIQVPPLRRRRSDLALLVSHFYRRFAGEHAELKIAPRAWAALLSHSFPGNVRELEHAIQHAVVLARGGEIDIWHLPHDLRGEAPPEEAGTSAIRSLSESMRDFERQCLLVALNHSRGAKCEAARMLGISRKTLWEKLKSHQIGSREE